jgi:hypothetical protein
VLPPTRNRLVSRDDERTLRENEEDGMKGFQSESKTREVFLFFFQSNLARDRLRADTKSIFQVPSLHAPT